MFRFTDLIIFELTRDCNLHCKYCYVKDKHLYKGEVMDFDLYKKVINEIVKERLIEGRDGRLCFNFHGGEFTLVGKKRFKSYVEYAIKTFCENKIKFELGCQTNATLIDDEWIELFKHYGINVGVSFDSFYEDPPLRFTYEQKDHVIEVLKKLRKFCLTNGVLSVISKNNIELTDKDNSYYIEGPHGDMVPVHRKSNFVEDTGNPYHSKYELSGKEIFEKLYKKYIDEFIETGMLREEHTTNIVMNSLTHLLTNHSNPRSGGCNGKFCGAGLTMISTRPDGTALYCDRYKKDYPEAFIKNLLDYDFLGIHQLKKAFEFTIQRDKSVRETGCDSCPAECICEYGCAAMYYSKFGKYGVQEDLVCDQYKLGFNYVKDNLDKILLRFKKNYILLGSDISHTDKENLMNAKISPPKMDIMSVNEFGEEISKKLKIRLFLHNNELDIIPDER